MGLMTTTQMLTGIRDWVLGKLSNITSLIPSQASAQNQLADKAFVNSSIATATATFRGTYNLVSDLGLTTQATRAQIASALATKMATLGITPDTNDYAFVQIPDEDETPTVIESVDRYKYNGSAWGYEFTLNNSGFTAEQWAAINSGVTSGDMTKLRALPTSAELTTLLNGKQDVIQDLADIRSGASSGATAVQPATLNSALSNTVAESGVYDVTANNNNAKFASLSVLLSSENLDTLIPSAKRKGGMSIKFVQWADNKYVQYRLLAEEFSANVDDWEHEASVENLEKGTVIPALATNLASWEGEEGESDYVQTEPADTTGGTLSIDSSMPANLLSVVPTSDFGATALVATGFNLLRFATAVGAGWYILVPKLTATAASIGTAQENNGVLFTDAEGNNLRPTVRFKALADGVPTSVTDGVAATYVDADGRRHYTTSGIGYLIVSDINRATTCMHLAWSRRYDEYVAVDAAGDAGVTVNLAAGINALHDFGLMLQIGALADSIERTSATQVTWYRRIDRVQPTWTNTPVEEEGVATGRYLHEALISNMRPDGAAAFMGSDQALTVTGTTVSYTDGNAEALTNYVKFELAAVVSGTASVSSGFAVEDWGLILIQGATGTAAFTIAYAQGIPDNLRTALPQLNAIRNTAAAISLGQGICSTDTYTKDKVVTIPNFLLLTNGHIDVLFTTPINTDLTTLNVSLTGAKPIRILGQNLPAGVIKAQTYATLVYDGTAWNIVNLFCPDAQFDPAGLLVDMGLPSGVKWASRDIDLTKPGGFCDTPFTYMKSFFSWGNIDGHNPISNSAFSYNWGSVNGTAPYYEGQPYGSTPGNTLNGNIAVGEAFDAARANLGDPWRTPTSANFNELFANIRYINADGTEVDTTKADKRVSVNGILGLYLESKINGARLFFSCSGFGYGRSWSGRGSRGYYWSSTFSSARHARYLVFYSGGVYPQYSDGRFSGFGLRPVQ